MYPIIAKIIRLVIAITCPNSTKRKYSVNRRSLTINNKSNKINIIKIRHKLMSLKIYIGRVGWIYTSFC